MSKLGGYGSMLNNRNTYVIDAETKHSANDCRHCHKPKDAHHPDSTCLDVDLQYAKVYDPIGWRNYTALGLSIGCAYSYQEDKMIWFDEYTLEDMLKKWVEEQPLLVGFNTIAFDFSLFRGILRQRADDRHQGEDVLHDVCDEFEAWADGSYDILAEIWKADPERKFERGLNSLDAISQANGLGPKLSHGAQAPCDWADGRYADVLNYCQDDVLKTRALFEIICRGAPILRGDGRPIQLPIPEATP